MTDNELPPFISGVNPGLSMTAESEAPRTESGIGALMPWADKLWAVTYPSHGAATGNGTGLYEIGEDLTMEKHEESVVGTYANRMIHSESDQAIIGPHIIDADAQVRTFDGLLNDDEERPNRLTATMEHLDRSSEWVYFLTMEGLLYEANVDTLEANKLFDLNDELNIEGGPQATHFKGGHTSNGRVVVANNTYDEAEYTGEGTRGRLAEWNGDEWRILEEHPFMEVTGRSNLGEVIFATGWDRRSAILKVFAENEWSTYRLPKGSHTYDHTFQTEWTRIREVETERYLMDCHGLFYELTPTAYDGNVWGIDPICKHLRIVPDYCGFRGMFVMAGNQTTPNNDANVVVGQPQSGLWLGKTDDLWEFGKPKGWGGPWREDNVNAGQSSDPYLMTGFDEKCVHFEHDADEPVEFTIEIDFDGSHRWRLYRTVTVDTGGYKVYDFPDGFSAHWVRFATDLACEATVQLTYS
jgi:hypothetical protein